MRYATITAAAAATLAACGPDVSSQQDNIDAAILPDLDADPSAADARPSDQPDGAFDECASEIYSAEQDPTAMLVVLDRSASMAQNNKWTFAAQALVQAIDQDVFDSVHLGLYVAPTGTVAGPACIFNLPVACQAPPFPQIDLALAGSMKSSDASGVRRDIRDWVTVNAPDSGIGDASPLYNALQAAIGTLQAWPEDGNRILFVVTDGSISCTQFSSRDGFADCNGCTHDWEHPQNIIDLLAGANNSMSAPIYSFLVGVPGADTHDPSACEFPPYRMRLALSAMASAGAPDFVPPTCDGHTFTQGGADPTVSCHFDMTQGNFSTQAIADAITEVRGEAVGCVFNLPEPPPGETIDPDEVNVTIVADGDASNLGRRSDPTDLCEQAPGCWDYTDDGDVELIGAACDAAKGASSVDVEIIVGCETIIL